MLPTYWHLIFGTAFATILHFLVPDLKPLYFVLVFLSIILIDIDHFFHLKHKKRYMHFFHTIESHIIIGLLGFLWTGFFYIFIGMIFHSFLDLIWMLKKDRFYEREYFFFNLLRNKLFNKN